MKKGIAILFLLFGLGLTSTAQGLLDELGDEEEPTYPTLATFETTRIVNGHSVEQPNKRVLLFIISHRFGRVSDGFYELFGLDQANIRFGLEYGITDRLTVGFGRSSNPKTLDGYIKAKILQQSSGSKSMPLTLSALVDGAWDVRRWADPAAPTSIMSSRFAYTYQLLIARKFTKRLSLQLSPTMIHKNLVREKTDANDLIALGLGGRYKVGAHWAINAEYFHLFPLGGDIPDVTTNFPAKFPLSLGVDLETGGHVFQFMVTNSLGAFNRNFMTETTDSWGEGQLHVGFNITRVFNFKDKKKD